MTNPKITVITVCYNAVDTIEKTILSVTNQTYQNIEYIIIDGASTDGTVDNIRKYADNIAYFVSEPDKGIYDAMNKGINIATGDWINFMNSGDSFHELTTIEKIFSQTYNEEIGVVFGDAYMVRKGEIGNIYISNPFWVSKVPYKSGKGICHQSMFIKRNLLCEFPFDKNYSICADFKQAYDIYNKGWNFYNTHIIVSNFDVEGVSYQKRLLALEENAKIVGMNHTIKYHLFLLNIFLRESIKDFLRWIRVYK